MEETKNIIFQFIKNKIANFDNLSDTEINLLFILYSKFVVLFQANDELSRSTILDEIVNDNHDIVLEDFAGLDELDPTYGSVTANSVELKKLKKIQIKNFKGFKRSQEDGVSREIPFNNRLNVFFGSNGTGKTSLSEAIELCLTDTIKESSKRGFRNIGQYLGSYGVPTMIFEDDTVVTSKPFYDRYIFEKNRIDEFGKFKSLDRQERGILLSSIFGFDDLQRFIENLPKNIDAKIDTYINDHKTQLNTYNEKLKEIELEDSQIAQIKIDYISGLKGLGKAETELESYKVELEKERSVLEGASVINFINIDELTKIKNIGSIESNIKHLEEQIATSKPGIEDSIISLYKIIEKNKFTDKSKCPICQTSVLLTTKNPFEFPLYELSTISNYTSLQEQLSIQNEALIEAKKILISTKSYINRYLDLDLFESATLNNLKINNEDLSSEEVSMLCVNDIKLIELIYNEIESHNTLVSTNKVSHSTRIEEINNNISQITTLKTIGSTIVTKEQKVIDLRKSLLIYQASKETEEQKNSKVGNFKSIYRSLYDELSTFKNTILQTEAAQINADVKKYYNILNNHDEITQQIESIEFGLSEIKIKFQDGDETYRDVLCELSEGHLKCLGLAILFARAKKYNAKFLIFDDVINAIDTDHRANIIDLMIDQDFSGLQYIISTHDRFFDELLNNCSEFSGQDVNRYIIHYNTHRGIIMEPYHTDFENKTQYYIDHEDFRSAVSHCRIRLENLVMRHEKYYINVNCDKGKIGSIEFKSTIFQSKFKEKITSTLSSDTNIIHQQKYQNILDIINYFIDEPNNGFNWKILNQENHYLNEVEIDLRGITYDIKKTKVIEIRQKILELSSLLSEVKSWK